MNVTFEPGDNVRIASSPRCPGQRRWRRRDLAKKVFKARFNQPNANSVKNSKVNLLSDVGGRWAAQKSTEAYTSEKYSSVFPCHGSTEVAAIPNSLATKVCPQLGRRSQRSRVLCGTRLTQPAPLRKSTMDYEVMYVVTTEVADRAMLIADRAMLFAGIYRICWWPRRTFRPLHSSTKSVSFGKGKGIVLC